MENRVHQLYVLPMERLFREFKDSVSNNGGISPFFCENPKF